MPRSAAKFLGPLAGLLLVVHGYHAVGGLVLDWGWAEGLPGPSFVAELLPVLIALVIGRVLLSWLPPGPLGSHTPRDLPVTCAVSYLLGTIVLSLEARVLALVPLPDELGGATLLDSNLRLLSFAPWVVLAVLRLLTLPASMVPRHEPRHERSGPATLILQAIGVALCGALLLANRPYAVETLTWISLWIVLGHGLGQARRLSAGIAGVVVFGLSSGGAIGSIEPAQIAFGIGGAFTIGWLRRADRRACWLAAIGFAGCAVLGSPMYVLAGLSTLVLSSYPAQRRYAATASAACLLVIGLPGFFVWFIDHPPGASSRVDLVELMRVAFDMKGWGATSILVLATLVVAVALRVRSGLAPREQYALLLLFTLGFLAILPLPWDLTVRLESALDFVFPVAVLLVGLVWIPEEEPG